MVLLGPSWLLWPRALQFVSKPLLSSKMVKSRRHGRFQARTRADILTVVCEEKVLFSSFSDIITVFSLWFHNHDNLMFYANFSLIAISPSCSVALVGHLMLGRRVTEAGKNQLTQIDFMSSGQAHCFLILVVESEGKINTLICFGNSSLYGFVLINSSSLSSRIKLL
jgi:hypothetical protein